MRRRHFLMGMAGTPLAAMSLNATGASGSASRQNRASGRVSLKQSVMGSVWGDSELSFEERCRELARIGFRGMDLPRPEQVPILRDFGLEPTLMSGTGTSFQDGFIRRELHDRFEEAMRDGVDMCAELGCPNLIGFAGERRGMSYEEAADNTVAIFSRVKDYAEEKGVTLCMEITNSKVAADRRTDQTFNRLDWGLDVCRRVDSPRVKFVYDIYHVQISDGDVTRNLRDNIDMICHFHTAGVPSRNEIDDTQELNYRFIANTIAELGYTGYVAHEHRPGPGRDPIESLETCFEILNV